jgi:membrane protein implicated in regulation of membrane protease activity
MHPRHEFEFKRTDIWREGKWLDLWSVVHFLSGACFGFGMYIVHFDAVASVFLVLLSLVAYELWEAMVRIVETPQNRVMDVVVGMASFLPTFFFFVPSLSASELLPAFVAVLAINIALSYFGWRASRKAAALQRRLRERYERHRTRLHRRRERQRKRLDI